MCLLNDPEENGTIPTVTITEFIQRLKSKSVQQYYNVEGIGIMYYLGDNSYVIKPSDSATPTGDDAAWFDAAFKWSGEAAGLVSLMASHAEFYRYNDMFWRTAKGVKYYNNILDPLASTNKFVQGVQGIRKSRAYAKEAVKSWKAIGNTAAGVSIAFTTYDMTRNGINSSNSADMFFGLITFVPKIGWVISGVYGLANVAVKSTTDKDIGEHFDEKVVGTAVKVENSLRNSLYNFISSIYRWY